MEEIVKILLFAPFKNERLISYSKEQQVFNAYVTYLTVTKDATFPNLSEINF